MESFGELHQAVYLGDVKKVVEYTETMLEKKVDPGRILNEGLIGSLEKVGKEFAEGLLFLPEVMLCASAINEAMKLLAPVLAEAGVKPRGSIIIGTVKGDQHDIGKNIVTMMLKGAGFFVEDLGIDVAPERFVEEAGKGNCQVVAMSALLSTCLPSVEQTIQALKDAGIRERVKVLVGGAVMDEDKARGMGADGYAPDAARAVDACKDLLGLS